MISELGKPSAAARKAHKPRDPVDLLVIAAGAALGLGLVANQFVPLQLAVLLCLAAAGGMAVLAYGNAPRVLLGLILLDIPLQFDIHLFYRPEAELLGLRGGANVSLTLLCLLVLAVHGALQAANRRQSQSPRWLSPTIMLAAYVIISAASLIPAGDRGYVWFELSLMLPAFLVYLYIVRHVRTERAIFFVLAMLLVGLVLEASLAAVTSLFGEALSFFPGLGTTLTNPGALGRAEGTMGSPNVFGSYVVLLLAPAVGVLLARVPRLLRTLAQAAIPMAGLTLVLTFSRGAWMTGAVSIVLVGGVAIWRKWLSARTVGFLVVVGVVTLVAFSGPITTRLFSDDGGAAYSRIPLMRVAFDIIRDHPVFGVGINNLALVMDQYRIVDYGGEWMFQVHNKYLLVWAETGPFGLLAFLLFLGTTLWHGFRVAMTNHRLWSPIALGFTAAIIANSTHMLADSFTSRAQVQLLWVNAAIIVCIYRLVFPVPDTAGLPRGPGLELRSRL